ncbi:MAG TPA: hypothetical protein VM050_02070 [Patescibacteria group bacterium]|nr:hypothetical protein [Patescibacteria group bacterium]
MDDELQLHVIDDAISSGRIGLDTDPAALVQFDDVKVTTSQDFYVSHLLD